MARSVAELLPCPFGEIGLDGVRTIIATLGEERENLFFERKAVISPNSLAKACSAFANTYGGLLLVGVADDDDALVGIEPFAGEAQLWVKDTLRSRVLPLPSFRARWLPVDEHRGLLLVLVEESSATPHLLTRSGAIYVRNPGSSDPVPISDQRRLLDLTARGERADAAAFARAGNGLGVRLDDDIVTVSIALAATGVASGFDLRLFSAETPEYLSRRTWGDLNEQAQERRFPVWDQHQVGVRRLRTMIWGKTQTEGVALRSDGVVAIYRGFSQHSLPRRRTEGQAAGNRATGAVR